VQKPDIDWYTRRLAGLEGMAQRDLMLYLRVDALVTYIKQLENEKHGEEELQ
jgi:hypothetical protein